ncbi:hypothetical protein IV454_25745 [Massilia antarctica]|uniref:Uncharacterized protein n=1 Tax=Massilia antarctica TaxID=2765360 RepID=A0AA48WA90_9BURK|nr:hypothetical protein [Massilia antarctica]QPI48866.1 hypothetical protein IV454_25745 [Massilia antarctica]
MAVLGAGAGVALGPIGWGIIALVVVCIVVHTLVTMNAKKPNVEAKNLPSDQTAPSEGASGESAGMTDAQKEEAAKLDAEAQAEAAAEDATTVVAGTEVLKCGEAGTYGELLEKSADKKFDRDHVPSKASLQKAAEKLIRDRGIDLTKAQTKALFGPKGAISLAGRTIAIFRKDHQKHSDTYGGRNNGAKIEKDSGELQKAAEKDTKRIEDAEGKEMDADCAAKYAEAAKEIRKKTHSEYESELNALIDHIINTVL